LTRLISEVLAIVANLRGVNEALKHSSITCLGYPFSVSKTFQKRNTNSDITSSLSTVEELILSCDKANKTPVIYLSMAFGNPYGDDWNEDIVSSWSEELVKRGASILALSDTTGVATPESISTLFKQISSNFPDTEIGVHLHSTPESWKEKIDAAYQNGCRRFDSALKGYGGCPMASDTLTGNIATESLIGYLNEKTEALDLNMGSFHKAMDFSSQIFH
jgi:hydroxymethylglutaryl-CoA lyase